MENIEKLKNEITDWAVERGQEHVAIEISRMWFLLGGGNGRVRLHQIEDENGAADWRAIYNNRQQIFRWLRCESKAARAKTLELADAMTAALPGERRSRLDDDSLNYVIAILVRDMSAAIIAALFDGNDLPEKVRTTRNSLEALATFKIKKLAKSKKPRTLMN
ncbi:hypothetical protein BIY27_25000 [Gibbsiella quercinecans]|uniref:toxin YdaT family protein n=1 Tax=Gibbsiella quercinecans TaxID=929813 RepID=UPI000EF1C6F9|nr:toxin YdaT family protein [Gibbsiella quercinecans]RLM02473.1 hypothetical protein BIY27_25000 [Gibbsiella quercinecans]